MHWQKRTINGDIPLSEEALFVCCCMSSFRWWGHPKQGLWRLPKRTGMLICEYALPSGVLAPSHIGHYHLEQDPEANWELVQMEEDWSGVVPMAYSSFWLQHNIPTVTSRQSSRAVVCTAHINSMKTLNSLIMHYH